MCLGVCKLMSFIYVIIMHFRLARMNQLVNLKVKPVLIIIFLQNCWFFCIICFGYDNEISLDESHSVVYIFYN